MCNKEGMHFLAILSSKLKRNMTEVSFIRQNLEKWNRMEAVCVSAGQCAPDELAAAYQELTADLAFAQTHFPEARITEYLNDLSLALHLQLYKRRPMQWRRVWHFLSREVPLAFYGCRRELLASLVVFLVGALIGCFSQAKDPDFANIILGEYYVNMTLENIEAGQPMAVYDSDAETDMFLGITLNNVRVAFMCFSAGLLTLFGTGVMLLHNSVMIGAFQTFFVQHGLAWESALAVWLHGTLEISAIIVAGAAGIRLGTGWLFPETFTRKEAFKRSAKQALRVVTGTVPLLVVAGFIEGFFTRHTEWPDALRLGIILLSLAFVIYYVVVLPRRCARRSTVSSKL